jgi:Inositol monophosphatase family
VKRISVTSNTGSDPVISSPAKGRFCLGVEKSIADALGECNAMAQILHNGGDDGDGGDNNNNSSTTTTTTPALDQNGEIITAIQPRMDSMAKYAMVARGDAEYYVRLPRPDYIENIWDHAAASVVLQEAGGTVTDTEGRVIDFGLGGAQLSPQVRGILASNGGWFHASLVQSYATQKKQQRRRRREQQQQRRRREQREQQQELE